MTHGSDLDSPDEDAFFGEGSPDDSKDILLFLSPEKDRQLLADRLRDIHRVQLAESKEDLNTEFDLCIVGSDRFNQHQGLLKQRTQLEVSEFIPVILLLDSNGKPASTDSIWDIADDVIEPPIDKNELVARVDSLLDRRRTSVELVEKRQKLSETIDELRMKDRAMEAAPIGITITDPAQEDNPIIYTNPAFHRISGYEADEIRGENCRILQGEDTDEEPVEAMRDAIDDNESVAVDVLNYRKNGAKFWNKVEISPVRENGDVVNYVGFHTDITDRKIREQRLNVLNRVLSHNLRNKLNIIEGYAATMSNRTEDEELAAFADQIDETVSNLQDLSDGVRRIEKSLPTPSTQTDIVDMDDVIERIVEDLRDQYPEAKITTEVPKHDCRVNATGASVAIREAAENALKHNDRNDCMLHIQLSTTTEPPRTKITLSDNGPPIPETEREVLQKGVETPLEHSDGVGLWLIHWIVSNAGGDVIFDQDDDEGNSITLSFPDYQEHQLSPGGNPHE